MRGPLTTSGGEPEGSSSRNGGLVRSAPFSPSPIPSASVSFPGPEHSSRSGRGGVRNRGGGKWPAPPAAPQEGGASSLPLFLSPPPPPTATDAHLVEAVGRLEGADQDGGGVALGFADEVEQAVDPIGEVDVGAPRGPE